MKFFTNKIQVKANPEQMSLGLPKPPKPATPTGPTFNAHNSPESNIFHDLEGPELQNFSIKPPKKIQYTGDGIRGAAFHHGDTDKREGVAKGDANSVLTEPLAYHIGEHLAPGLVPPTVIRNHKNINTPSAELTPHSVQKAVEGRPMADLRVYDWQKLRNEHPDYSRMSVFDYLMGNNDRHEFNQLYEGPTDDPEYGQLSDIPFRHPLPGRIHAIDNGGAFNYDDDENGQHSQIKNNMSWSVAPIPEDMRKRILNADEGKLKDYFDRVRAHPLHDQNPAIPLMRRTDTPGFMMGNFEPGTADAAWKGFHKRLGEVRKHLADPTVRSARDLGERLYARAR